MLSEFDPITLSSGINWQDQEYVFESGETFYYDFDLPESDYLGDLTYSYSTTSTLPIFLEWDN